MIKNPVLNYAVHALIMCLMIAIFQWKHLGFLGTLIFLMLGSISCTMILIVADLTQYFRPKLLYSMLTGYIVGALVAYYPIKSIAIALAH